VIFENFLPGDILGECVNDISASCAWLPARVYRLTEGGVASVAHDESRRGETLFPHSPVWKEVMVFVLGLARKIEESIGVPIRGCTDFQVHRYGVGDFFAPHRDQGSHIPDSLFTIVGGLVKPAGGGELKLFEPEERLFSLTPGRVIAFPSHILHSGEAVTVGTKVVFVTFLLSDVDAFF
jgi:predicted 2-oxoglutarate/Fe(II)-dependent dioxygenase YbiX